MFSYLLFSCQYQCSQLPGKAYLELSTGRVKKVAPRIFADFSEMTWNFNTKFYYRYVSVRSKILVTLKTVKLRVFSMTT